ncbi:hypothetical protein [Pseudobacteriovorax antillogorgiicola]|uniref:Uncharacterized protein n=1 Tax=Pseudobacteriovorax antillogorgiicola TaxID=1513793 RepID=A0A1Y6C0N8_9BACT|nr:hypothetical protein [Pseudobacteriovorax antillogorgiicola]TCS52306.1 hypothetical protein EDD56_10950 [Pseudobacteriovorax antillogorgiicola]SMF30331.1 hypothetical protein SAMN06296036_109163 [Pseudobacteriovorax antillogorgiicola]
MKQFMIAMLLTCVLAPFAHAGMRGNVTCTATGNSLRQLGNQEWPAQAYLNFRMEVEGQKASLSRVVGHIAVSYDDLSEGESIVESFDVYYGSFSHGFVENNPQYKPRVYLNHFQFPFNANHTTSWDGGGMWGHLVIPQNPENEFSAHYIFQAGSHMGGTVDLNCRGRLYRF